MKYPLQDLLKIRILREQMAKDALIKAQNYLEETIRKVENAERELAEYKKWRVEEEERLYAEVINKKVKLHDLDGLKVKLADLEEKEMEYIKVLDDAKEEHERAKERLEEARVVYNQKLMSMQKIEEHKGSWLSEWKKEQEMIADREIEDFKALQIEY